MPAEEDEGNNSNNNEQPQRSLSCCERGLCVMKKLVHDPGEDIGFVYTYANSITGSNVNLKALNVPRDKATDLGMTVSCGKC